MSENRKLPDVWIARDGSDAAAASAESEWAAGYLAGILRSKELTVIQSDRPSAGGGAKLSIVLTGSDAAAARSAAEQQGIGLPEAAEAFAIIRHAAANELIAVGADVRGLVYAVLELADTVKHSADPLEALTSIRSFAEKPTNRVRSVTRLFSSEAEDKAWFYDEGFWESYLTELATHRFNRFTLGTGAGYDYLIDKIVEDTYLCFIYPYLLPVPGYSVYVDGLADTEREKNLQMLQYIGEQAKLRGLTFRLGLWNHAYDYGPDNTNTRYKINGLDASNHASYCRDALKLLLQACPAIEGITFRVHFEGGVPEPTHDFWRVVMEGLQDAGRSVEVDFHAKGVNGELVDIALNTGMPVVLSTKFWGEHMGLSYHQASIRDREFVPRPLGARAKSAHFGIGNSNLKQGGMDVTSKRSYTRYGFADYYRDDRKYGIVHRVWPGTQRVLTWGDPEQAAGYGRSAGFCGSLGVEWFEPLSFKGRKGSGSPGGRELYADESLRLGVRDWSKFSYTYRLLGRLSYDPDADPETWRRFLRSEFQDAATACEAAMAYASRILPLILVAHAPSVANNVYWPEMYANMPLFRSGERIENIYQAYGYPYNYDFDTPAPHTFGSASPLDPVLIYGVNEFADDILAGKRRGKYSPLEIADWLDDLAGHAELTLSESQERIRYGHAPSFRRWAADVRIMAGIGRFFSQKFRAGLAYALFERAGDAGLLKEAIHYYHAARDHWKRVIEASSDVYKEDLTFGRAHYSRGHWSDRLSDIDKDIQTIERIYSELQAGTSPEVRTMDDMLAAVPRGERPPGVHAPVSSFIKGEPMEAQLTFTGAASGLHVLLHYRHVNQAESYATLDMERQGDSFRAWIPAAYTMSPYPIAYFFEVRTSNGDAWMIPGFENRLSNQPYYIIQTKKDRSE
ncbi:hypothetical protein [Paenibacillus piri]|uniref:Uncharacterized protein n=1 Tax=Paenibacillus piri TaxID=2547395 RepID=A0A4R5KJ87_9BACL|nr:hypothetical protein [Paenibacillus piri]TDF95192.1 hypothetical protein E1757_21985 [Paenibacillus piri]